MRPAQTSIFALVLSFVFISWAPFAHRDVAGQAQQKNEDPPWYTALYEEDVRYGVYACTDADAEAVSVFFLEHPISHYRPICHNDCPVIKCRPVIQVPSIAQAAKVTGTISVHILVDEEGETIYARVLDGHPLLLAVARRAACETQFRTLPRSRKRQGVMHFYIDGTGFLGIPYSAAEVSASAVPMDWLRRMAEVKPATLSQLL